MGAKAASSVDNYLASVSSEDARTTLVWLRKIILETIPEAEEVIKYGIPTYKYHGYVASFAAYKNHCSFFPGHTIAEFAEELKGYIILKGTIQFPHDKPLAESLVKAIVKARAEENRLESHK